jgi:hypothetical protein
VIEGYVIETGTGFIITIDYNRFREIFESKNKKKNNNQKNSSKAEKQDEQKVSGDSQND